MANHLFVRNLNICGQEISVLRRSLDGSDFDTHQPVETFTEIDTPTAIVKTIASNYRAGDTMFGGIHILPDSTHIFCVLYTPTLAQVENQNYFIDLKTERYKVIAVTNDNEEDQVLIFQTTKRGDSSLGAAEA